jgi:hypothetical protein
MEGYAKAIKLAVEFLIGDLLKPQASAVTLNDGIWVNQQYAAYSQKMALMAIPAAVVGMAAALAMPAFNNVQTASTEAQVLNNLRMVSAAAQMHMLEYGVTEVHVAELIGPDRYIYSLDSVVGENYLDIDIITIDTQEISVSLPDGRVVSYRMW